MRHRFTLLTWLLVACAHYRGTALHLPADVSQPVTSEEISIVWVVVNDVAIRHGMKWLDLDFTKHLAGAKDYPANHVAMYVSPTPQGATARHEIRLSIWVPKDGSEIIIDIMDFSRFEGSPELVALRDEVRQGLGAKLPGHPITITESDLGFWH